MSIVRVMSFPFAEVTIGRLDLEQLAWFFYQKTGATES
jgi:hypothetical protein